MQTNVNFMLSSGLRYLVLMKSRGDFLPIYLVCGDIRPTASHINGLINYRETWVDSKYVVKVSNVTRHLGFPK